jgi:hypothetical protein
MAREGFVQRNCDGMTRRSAILSRMPKHPSHILELAKRGAEQRYHELKAELDSLVKDFPHLQEIALLVKGRLQPSAKRQVIKASRSAAVSEAPTGPKGWSAAARKAVSARMKRYWAAKRKAAKQE